MSYRIVEKQQLNKEVIRIEVLAPIIAQKAKAGQFVVLVIDDRGERIPLTLANWDKAKGTITLIFQAVGFSTKKLATFNINDDIAHVLGPLGHPTDIKNLGEIYCIGGGVGIAEVYPVSSAFKRAGNRVIGIIGARSRDLIILEKEMKAVCDELFITSDDGSYGRKGYVSDILKEFLDVVEKSAHTKYPNLVYAIGPVPMMKAVSNLTKPCAIKTIVSLNPIMVDATGMCGACRCTIGDKTVFACVEGPDFNADQVNFDELEKRLELFKLQEESIK